MLAKKRLSKEMHEKGKILDQRYIPQKNIRITVYKPRKFIEYSRKFALSLHLTDPALTKIPIKLLF